MEAEGVTVAAVEGCQGIERVRFSFTGQAAHAGTTPMAMRRDAGLAAAACAACIAALPADTAASRRPGSFGSSRASRPPWRATLSSRAISETPTLKRWPRCSKVPATRRGKAPRLTGASSRRSRSSAIAPTTFDADLVATAARSLRDAERAGVRDHEWRSPRRGERLAGHAGRDDVLPLSTAASATRRKRTPPRMT